MTDTKSDGLSYQATGQDKPGVFPPPVIGIIGMKEDIP
jgi:hypothetical protein